jgi:protein phosphatase PTC7
MLPRFSSYITRRKTIPSFVLRAISASAINGSALSQAIIAREFHHHSTRYGSIIDNSSAPSTATDIIAREHFHNLNFDDPSLDKITAADILQRFGNEGRVCTVGSNATLLEAIQIMTTNRVGCLVAIDNSKQDNIYVAGLITERDVINDITNSHHSQTNCLVSRYVSDIMTQSKELISVSSDDNILDCLLVMSNQGFRHLPVLEKGDNDTNSLRGIISMRNIIETVMTKQTPIQNNQCTEYSANISQEKQHKPNEQKGSSNQSSKARYLTDILPRLGLPSNTSIFQSPNNHSNVVFHLESAVVSVPHPDKKKSGGEDSYVVYNSTNLQYELDNALGSHAKNSVLAVNSAKSKPPFNLLAVFDGVGSWSFEQGIDAAKFSRSLSQAAIDLVTQSQLYSPSATNSDLYPAIPTPLSILNHCWQSAKDKSIIGSSTACILTLSATNQLQAVNIGDSGFIVLRPMLSNSMSDPALFPMNPGQRQLHYAIIYRSPQQLHWFNCPYQLGIDSAGNSSKFDSPNDSEQLTVTVQENDLILLATDGLFDNITEEEILSIMNGQIPQNNSNSANISMFTIEHMVAKLAQRAQQLSMDKSIDSPFGLLAKDNNIMWSGGRKDDITIILSKVGTKKMQSGWKSIIAKQQQVINDTLAESSNTSNATTNAAFLTPLAAAAAAQAAKQQNTSN